VVGEFAIWQMLYSARCTEFYTSFAISRSLDFWISPVDDRAAQAQVESVGSRRAGERETGWASALETRSRRSA